MPKEVRLIFEDEAVFGCNLEPKYCRCKKKIRPTVPRQIKRQFQDVFGAIEPQTGKFIYSIIPKSQKKTKNVKFRKAPKGSKSRQLNAFLSEISKNYRKSHIVLICDNASWYKSKYMKTPKNMTIMFIPPCTPEMNPIEQICREIRTRLENQLFANIEDLTQELRKVISEIPTSTMCSITQRDWIMECHKLKEK
jgi:putative transposase